MPTRKTRVAIATGPTGGHFFPGLAIGEGLTEKNWSDVVFFVPDRKYLTVWLKKKGFEYRIIPEVRLSLKNVLFPFKFLYAFFRACLFLADGKFDGLVITGSYATVPFLPAAKLYGIKIFVHEQNFFPGKVTKVSAFIADRIALSFPCFGGLPKEKSVVAGFPIISDFRQRLPRNEMLNEFGLSPGNVTVLVLGGSQGAVFLNEMVAKNLDCMKGRKVQFIHLAGRDKEQLAGEYEKCGVSAKVYDFYFDMAKLYSVADIVICRAGAGTLAEISEWGLPAVVVPYPHAGGHQKYNALYFAERGGCRMLEQGPGSMEKFPSLFESTLNETDNIRRNLAKISISDSRGDNVSKLLELLDEKEQS